MTPEERSVIEAALTWTEQVFMNHSPTNYDRLKEACDALRQFREPRPRYVAVDGLNGEPRFIKDALTGEMMNTAEAAALLNERPERP